MEDKNSIKYDKLIRDRIPEIIEAAGKKPVVEVLDRESYKKHLDTKLFEELDEYRDSDSIEELADLVEVIYALVEYKGVSLQQFDKIRQEKADKRGRFEKRLVLKEVITPSN